MSEVPEKTSTRPSGLILIHACDGSPFWFIPVGYSIAAKPRPVAEKYFWKNSVAAYKWVKRVARVLKDQEQLSASEVRRRLVQLLVRMRRAAATRPSRITRASTTEPAASIVWIRPLVSSTIGARGGS